MTAKKHIKQLLLLIVVALVLGFSLPARPTLYIIGDSTVRNTNQVKWGWGTLIADYLDTAKMRVNNLAIPGRSTRTFLKEGRWAHVDSLLQPGDYVMIQFGHNESAVPDTSKAGYRGVLKGAGADSVLLTWPNGKKETVHAYGWYLRKFIREAKVKGATPIIVSMIPRNEWLNGKVILADKDYGKWAAEVAQQQNVPFIDLNGITARKYNLLGPERVKAYFPADHTHTNREGAIINAESVIEGIRSIPCFQLNDFLKK
ncbi:rhamnogalacturonan acetylesterase [Mucilaginibacter sp. FT3.2]|uniref:rhamnogalacturonan acetylesterase n=1 Tax=Mucilaginibacter sp. FT3.2 TaxID=2723090 RepID=UPI0016178D85|nr:rhamnogalacturonan acetylesterase [Mucilaginibacter sp. FT3.2]MBB6233849.1 lysophospholipase L1-like esterase [Mucilaginibacter sp. FT3.2]